MLPLTPETLAQKLLGLAASLLLITCVGALGAWASISAADFYGSLNQPIWAPPAGVFGPAWTSLFILMAVAAWRVWVAGAARNHPAALVIYALQLVFNVLWSWLFFAWHLGGAAFLNILLLWSLILFCLISFYSINRVAGLLLVPYLAWVTFAAFLNYHIWQLNPALL